MVGPKGQKTVSAAGVLWTSASGNCKLGRAAVYVRRRPERSAAYQVVRQNLETWLAQRRSGRLVAGTCYEYEMFSGALSVDRETYPNTLYGIAKDKLRKELFELQQSKNFYLTWTRNFYPHGDGQSSHSFYSLMKSRVNSSNSEIQLSNSEGILDFIFVIELSEILTIFTLNADNAGVVNLGSGHPKLVIDFARDIAKANDWTLTFTSEAESSRKFESNSFWSDNFKLKNLLSKYNPAK